jgi:cytochrome P450
MRDPLGFLAGLRDRYGDVFSVRFPYFGRIVYVADPELVKEVFTGSPAVFHAGEANATVLEPALGPNSVLTLDDEPHMQQRKLLLPPFHGERVRRYGELIREVTRREMETWPVGRPFALRPHTQKITLAVILRAVFGIEDERRIDRAGRLIDAFSDRVTLITKFPSLRRDLGPFSPWRRFLRARAELDEFLYPAPRRSGERGARRRPLAAAAGAPRRGHADERRGAPRRADDRGRCRSRDDGDRPGLGGRAPAAQPASAGPTARVGNRR